MHAECFENWYSGTRELSPTFPMRLFKIRFVAYAVKRVFPISRIKEKPPKLSALELACFSYLSFFLLVIKNGKGVSNFLPITHYLHWSGTYHSFLNGIFIITVSPVVSVPAVSSPVTAERRDGPARNITSLTPWVTWRPTLWEVLACPRVSLLRRCKSNGVV